jgi:peptide/nickel transport system permease protein
MRKTLRSRKMLIRNWWLLGGVVIVSLVLTLAFKGPSLAPKNPLEKTLIMQVDGKWLSAPYPPNTPGFPLGSDQWGRDILSQLLWALRPTLILVAFVAALRLGIGILIGLLAGWLPGIPGRVLDGLIRLSIAIPAIIVALAVVVAFQIAWGANAFAFGLTLTGWAEAARIVRDHTRIVRQQLYIEAGRSLGHSSIGLIWVHVLRQILPYVWMLMAFEISNTLLLVAGLGFLGYYVGGEVWVWISDTAATRLSGMPELGQMLSTVGSNIYTNPWGVFAAGCLVFIAMLGFNLLGEGLRRAANAGARSTILTEWIRAAGWKIERRIFEPLQQHAKARPFLFAVETVILLALFISGARAYAVSRQPRPVSYPTPGGHLWASQFHDPYGTLWADVPTLDEPSIAWTYADQDGFAGGPAIASNGTLYLLSSTGTLSSLDPDGNLLWQAHIEFEGIGTPALDADGNIYITDAQGGLSSFTPGGQLRWRFQPEKTFPASPGLIVGMNGIAYYVVIGDLIAVSVDGSLVWQMHLFDRIIFDAPALNPDNSLLFLGNTIVDTFDGKKKSFDSLPVAEQYLVGLDGRLYSRFERAVSAWEIMEEQAVLLGGTSLQFTSFLGFAGLEGVLHDGTIWQQFNSEYSDSALIWWNKTGDPLASVRFPYRPSRLIGIDRNTVFYVCGTTAQGLAECAAVKSGTDSPEWKLSLSDGSIASGGALVSGSMYVALAEGYLYAIRVH